MTGRHPVRAYTRGENLGIERDLFSFAGEDDLLAAAECCQLRCDEAGHGPVDIRQHDHSQRIVGIVREGRVEPLDATIVLDDSVCSARIYHQSEGIIVLEWSRHLAERRRLQHLAAKESLFPLEEVLSRGIESARALRYRHVDVSGIRELVLVEHVAGSPVRDDRAI